MKVLYAFQGTGNGHTTRAAEIIPTLRQYAKVDVLVSGTQADLNLAFPIDYKLKGMSFTFGKQGGIDLRNTYTNLDSRQLLSDIRNLPVEKYDLVINDFEPVSAWASQNKMIPCVSLSHQSAVLHPKAPRPGKCHLLGKMILKHFAPAHYNYGFHFQSYDEGIYTPVIRDKIRNATIQNLGHYVVYLPAYSDEKILTFLKQLKGVEWKVFSKKCTSVYTDGPIKVFPIADDLFAESMASAEGVLCGAGFETPAEALFLGKKVLVIPMKGQYEQQCNARALADLGVPVIHNLANRHLPKVQAWLNQVSPNPINYPKHTESVVEQILKKH